MAVQPDPQPAQLVTRQEVLAGLPAKRAASLLFLIENRAANLAARSQRVMERYLSEAAEAQRELEFLEAFAQGREPPRPACIQDIERYAPQWASLVPGSNRVRAAVAHLLREKYAFRRSSVPALRQALGLDQAEVQQAYQRLYRAPLNTIYTHRVHPLEAGRWAWSSLAGRLENLPAFWMAFSLTLTEIVGASILALPIALAGVGPLAGVAFLAVMGLVNILTIAQMAESMTRSGSVRYGRAYLGRLVADTLGSSASLVFTLALAVLNFLVLIAYYVGFASTLQGATGLPAWGWALLLFLVSLYFLWSRSLNATVSSALLIGAANILLILLLSLLSLPFARAENLAYTNLPFRSGEPFDAGILALIFGVAFASFFGHTSIANGARVVLQKEPGGRSLLWGCIAAEAVALGLYSIWVLAVNGAIPASELAGQAGTALVPLVARLGPAANLIGSTFTVLALGMAFIHFSIGFSNLIRERLPSRSRPVVVLGRQGRLVFHPKNKIGAGISIHLRYLGLSAGQARFRLVMEEDGRTFQVEKTAGRAWEITPQLERWPGLDAASAQLRLDVLQAAPSHARLRIFTGLHMAYEAEWEGSAFRAADLLELPADEGALLRAVLHHKDASLPQVMAHSGQEEAQAYRALQALEKKGVLRRFDSAGETRYQAMPLRSRGSHLPPSLWAQLDDAPPSGSGLAARLQAWRALGLGERGRFFISILPLGFIFLLVEWMFFTGAASFTEVLSYTGVITVTLLAGIFPPLLLYASRKKGEVLPARVYRLPGSPVVLGGVFLLSLAGILLHGLLIWDNPLARLTAILVSVLVAGMTLLIARRGAFTPRLVIEIRASAGPEQSASFNLLWAGKPAPLQLTLAYPGGEQLLLTAAGEIPDFSNLQSAAFQLPTPPPAEILVWAHRLTSTQESQGLAARVEYEQGGETCSLDLQDQGGQALIRAGGPEAGRIHSLRIRL